MVELTTDFLRGIDIQRTEYEVNLADWYAKTDWSPGDDGSYAINKAFDWYRSIDPTGAGGCRFLLPGRPRLLQNWPTPPGPPSPDLPFQPALFSPIYPHRASVLDGGQPNGATLTGVLKSGAPWTQPMITFTDEIPSCAFYNLQLNFFPQADIPMIKIDAASSLTMFNVPIGGDDSSTMIELEGDLDFWFSAIGVGAFRDVPADSCLIAMSGGARLRSVSSEFFGAVRSPALVQDAVAIRASGARGIWLGGYNRCVRLRGLIDIPAVATVRDVNISNIISETSSAPTVWIRPQSGGDVQSVKIDGRMKGGVTGVKTEASGTGKIGVVTVSADISGMSSHGIEHQAGSLVYNGQCAANSGSGIKVGGGPSPVTSATINGNLGTGGSSLVGNTGYGLEVTSAAHGPIRSMASVSGNTAGPVSIGALATDVVYADINGALHAERLQSGTLVSSAFGPQVELIDLSAGDPNAQLLSDGAFYIKYDVDKNGTYELIGFRVNYTASAASYLEVTPGASGGNLRLQTSGSDANIDMRLSTKGTGTLRFGTLTTSADVPITGYITIKDDGGTLRKLAVIA